MRLPLPVYAVSFVVMLPSPLQSQSVPTPPAISLIREQDLKADMLVMAGDAMRGRESGTLDELRASTWTADQLAKIGVKPFG